MCGIAAVYGPGLDVARLVYFGLYALQHRGQESAGIAVGDGAALASHREMGLLTELLGAQPTRTGYIPAGDAGCSYRLTVAP